MRSIGPVPADIMIVGEFPSRDDEYKNEPFSDRAGALFTKRLAQVGFLRTSCFITNVSQHRPPDDDISAWISDRKTPPAADWVRIQGKWVHPQVAQGYETLREEIARVQPKLIIAVGNAALWALTGNTGANKWRGSRLSPPDLSCTVVPTISPASALRQEELIPIITLDLKRAKAIYEGRQNPRLYKFQLAPTYAETLDTLAQLKFRADGFRDTGVKLRLSGDLETRLGHIACFGIAWSATEAICIPFLQAQRDDQPREVGAFYWTEKQEAEIVYRLTQLFNHEAIEWVGQNYLYDCQYFWRFWGTLPRYVFDTMIGHHSCFSNMRKGLDFLSAMYAHDHVYWKDESKNWDPDVGERQYWTYNCLAADTPVLMFDNTYKPLGEIVEGDKVLTFEENPSGHRFARVMKIAVVTKTAKDYKTVSRYTFSDGTFIDATSDHKILSTFGRNSRSSWQWKECKDLALGDRVASLGKPWKSLNTFEAGWLSGIYDGEGTVGFLNQNKGYSPYPRIGFSQKPGPVLDKALEILTKYGFSYRTSEKPSATYVDINGGLTEQLRLLGMFQPLRIGKNFHKYSYCEGLSGFSGLSRPILVSIEPIGTVPVADISTTEGTFIAGGIFVHNCKDACITWEIAPEIQAQQTELGNQQHHDFQQSLFFPVLRMMNRGIRLDISQRAELKKQLLEASLERQGKLDYMAGHELNPRSPLQLKKFFYDDLGLPVIHALNSDSITTNSPAMAEIANRFPPLRLLCQTITELRSISVFLGTFINAELDSDARMRCSFAVAGPTTFRFSSSENAFGSGMNLQNIPVAEKEKIKSADYIKLPNIRKLFIPDPGFTFFDMDLDRADLQVVVWEADDKEMKIALRENLDMHCLNACTIFDIKGIPFDELKETHPNYPDHRAKIGKANRDKAKIGVHATNYGVGDYKLSLSLGITRHEASRFRSRWFGAHPGIEAWHKRTETLVNSRGFIENLFGARLYKLGRFDLPEFLAWLPQSTVAGVINRALVAIDAAERAGQVSIQLLIQVHDSLAGQFPSAQANKSIQDLKRLAQVIIPYPDPLIIPVGIKTSTVSWGDCR